MRQRGMSALGMLWAGVAFFLSGASALVYQVTWQRILALHSGIGIYSVAMIVAAFMAGLGAGSYLGGRLSVRLQPRGALAGFALLELGVALFGAASVPLYYDWLYLRASWLYAPLWRAALLHLASLAVPTTLMGMSLPLLVRAMVFEARTAGRTIGFLYGVNVLGASAGAVLTPWFLIRFHGMRTAVLVAVAGNLIAGLGSLALGRLVAREPPRPPEPAPAAPLGVEPAASRPLGLWILLYAASGFCALALEIVWFRVIDLAVRATAFTFGTVLAVYLLGSALGSLLGAPLAVRLARPLRAFLLCQCAILAYAGASLLLLTALPPDTPFYRWYVELWGGLRSFNLGGAFNPPAVLRLYVVLPILLYGPPTVLMGLSFPVLQRAVQDDVATSGRKVGILQAANIAGCVLGSLIVGLVGLSAVGTTGALRALLVVGLGFAAVGMRAYGVRGFALPAVALLVLLAVLPGQRGLWLRLHGTAEGPALVEEDASGVVALAPVGDRWQMWVNGKEFGSLPFGGFHTWLGAVPAVVHPAPRDVAIIGLGSGDTAWASGCRGGLTRSVTVYEVCGPELRLLRTLARANPPPDLERFLADPRVRVIEADGRNAIEHAAQGFDVIEIDALRPTNAYAGNVYSLEFFSRCARKLNPGGLMCSWAPSARVRASFARAFPHVLEAQGGQILLGSNQPLALDLAAWRQRLESEAVASYLGRARVREVLQCLATAQPAPARAAGAADVNEDLFPRDELNTP